MGCPATYRAFTPQQSPRRLDTTRFYISSHPPRVGFLDVVEGSRWNSLRVLLAPCHHAYLIDVTRRTYVSSNIRISLWNLTACLSQEPVSNTPKPGDHLAS